MMHLNNHVSRLASLSSILFIVFTIKTGSAQSIASRAVNLIQSAPISSMPEAQRDLTPDPNAKVYIKDTEEDHEARLRKGLPGSYVAPRPAEGNAIERNRTNREAIRHVAADAKHSPDQALASRSATAGQQPSRSQPAGASLPAPSVSFEGISHPDTVAIGQGFIPPDTNGAAGPRHYVQTVNSAFRVWDKTGKPLTAPISFATLFGPLGDPCGSSIDGDPIVLYDQFADRWFISEFCLAGTPNYHQLIAVSKTGDPTGAYYLYDFMMPNEKFNDYPHFGVWTDAYYMTDNQFNHDGTEFEQAGVFAFDRAKMLAGDPTASYIYFDTGTLFPRGTEGSPNGPNGLGGMLPASVDGLRAPPAGAPGLFVAFQADEYSDPRDQLRIFDFHANFKNPSGSSFKEHPGSPLSVASFDPLTVGQGRNVVPQPPPANIYSYLDAIQDRLMFRLSYRNLGQTEALLLNHSVNAAVYPAYRAGIRFYELTRPAPTAPFTIAEQQTFDGISDDGINRWMGSLAMNFRGDIVLGYSASSETLFPSIRYAAKLGTDPAGSGLTAEHLMVAGKTSQTHNSGRWGDYSGMTVDPADDCSFWYTQEYYPASTEQPVTWHTRVVKVTPGSAAKSPRGTITGKITNCQTGLPVADALITIDGGYSRGTSSDGTYHASVLPGSYTATVTGAGYDPISSGKLQVEPDGTAEFSACLTGHVKQPVAASTSVTADSCNSNGQVDPNETVTVSFGIKNAGTVNIENLVATLQPTGGVAAPSAPQTYGTVVAGGPTVFRSFTFRVANMVCGAHLNPTLKLADGNTALPPVSYDMLTGATSVYNYGTGDIATPIPDYNYNTPDGSGQVGMVEIPIDVTDLIKVEHVVASVRLDHTFDQDLNIYLVHPDGTTVTLNAPFEVRNAAGHNYGFGDKNCSGAPTVFDDSADVSIVDAGPPFVGTFKPESPLRAFKGKPAAGTWKLRITDNSPSDTGTVWCVNLEFNRKQVCCGPLIASAPPARVAAESYAPKNDAPDPGETVTMQLPLVNLGVESTHNLVGTLVRNGHVHFGVTADHSQSYGILPDDGTRVSRPFTFSVTGDCGDTIQVPLALTDGSRDLGMVSFAVRLGKTQLGPPLSFSNPAAISVPGQGSGSSYGAPASEYPSTLEVSGVNGPIGKMTVTFHQLNHSFPADVDVILVSPALRGFVLMSDTVGQANWTGQTYTFDDDAAKRLPQFAAAAPATGSYKPTNYNKNDGDYFPRPVPPSVGFSGGPAGGDTLRSTFLAPDAGGVNGTWRLFIVDDSTGDIGQIAGGWELSFFPRVDVCGSP